MVKKLVRKTETYFCDICGKETERNYMSVGVRLPFVHPAAPKDEDRRDRVVQLTLDICYDCLIKSTNLRCNSCYGGNLRIANRSEGKLAAA